MIKKLLRLAEKEKRNSVNWLYDRILIEDNTPWREWKSGKDKGELITQENYSEKKCGYQIFEFVCNKPVKVKINGYEYCLDDGYFYCTACDLPVYSFEVLTSNVHYKWNGSLR